MSILVKILIGIVALEHIFILYLEMFLWTKPFGRKTFGMTKEVAESSKVLAANQGLYNGFLAAGLIWALVESNAVWARELAFFFLLCVLIAAIYGSLTAKKTILFTQGGPAFIALLALWFIG